LTSRDKSIKINKKLNVKEKHRAREQEKKKEIINP
jgi:hypothetical protein